MSIADGTRLGAFEITGQIGAGGMGEVYRATDTQLGRAVAIKTLPSSLANDAERLARFEREAKLLATLNHAHIASVYSLDEHDGTRYLAMELVEGETLEQTLKGGALSVDMALEYALQIAQALEAAHDKGVVHRDLKPANVMVTRDGVVKVLDFGLAKAFAGDPDQASPAHSPALSLAMTQAGLVLGTAGYMSPEQASGQATDQRADVWAFGVVLYEMLTGLPLFSGESVPHILAAVLQTEPDWTRLPKHLHPRLKLLLERCLTKKPRNRLHAIADARIEIEGIKSNAHDVTGAVQAPQPIWRRVLPIAATVLVTAVLAGLAVWTILQPEPTAPVRLILLQAPDEVALVNGFDNPVAISSTGRQVTYSAGGTLEGELRVRSLDALAATSLANRARSPFFSPDGTNVGYFDNPAGMLSVAVTGGASIKLADIDSAPRGASWGDDDTIVFATLAVETGLMRVPAEGGDAEVLTRPDTASGESGHWFPQHLPDRTHILFTIGRGIRNEGADVAVLDLSTGDYGVLIPGASYARYVESGHLVFAVAGSVQVAPFDLERLQIIGRPVNISDAILVQPRSGAAAFSVSATGTLVYVEGQGNVPVKTLAWIDREGNEEPIDVPPRLYIYAALSPDGSRIALDVRDEESDTWVFDLERQTLQRLTFDPGQNRGVVWSPDGQRLAFSREINGVEEVYWQAADGSGVPEALTESSGAPMYPRDITSDGATLIYGLASADEIWTIPTAGPPTAGTLLLSTPFQETNSILSPDDRWLAYQSNESGSDEIYVRPYPDVDAGRWQVSTGGGVRPLWRRDGAELFYLTLDGPNVTVWAVAVESGASFRAGVPRALFSYRHTPTNSGAAIYDVTPDGDRFLVVKDIETADEEPVRIVAVQNWFEELERIAPID